MALTLITPPSALPVSLEEAKKHLGYEADDRDDQITTYLKAAVQWIDGPTGWLGRMLAPQVWRWTFDTFPSGDLEIPFGPVISVDEIAYDDAEGTAQVIDEADYSTDLTGDPAWIVSQDGWPTTYTGVNAVRIDYTAGYADLSESPFISGVPDPIRAGILLQTEILFTRPEGPKLAALERSRNDLLDTYRRWRL